MKLKAFILTILISFILTGCTSTKVITSNKKDTILPVTIKYGFWGSLQEFASMQQIAENFNKSFPRFKLELIVYPDSETLWKRLPYEIAANTAPDIIKLTNEGYQDYVRMDMIHPLDSDYIKSEIDLNLYNKKALDIWTVNNLLYGMPISYTPAMYFINKDMWKNSGLNEYPKTWEDVKEACKKLTKEDIHGLCINLHYYHITNYILSFGGGWRHGKTINSKENVKALNFIKEMLSQKLAITSENLGLSTDGDAFANEKVVMSTGGYWYIGYLKKSAPHINYDIIPIPSGQTNSASAIHSDGIVILKNTSNIGYCLKAIKYLSSESVQYKLMCDIGFNPSILSVSKNYYNSNPKLKTIETIGKNLQNFDYPYPIIEFSSQLTKLLEEYNSRSSQSILDELQSKFGLKN